MARYGYSRVSTKGQEANGNSLDDQKRQPEEAGCDEIVLEAYTGTKMERPKFTALMDKSEAGEISIAAACKEMGVARAHRYRWKEALA